MESPITSYYLEKELGIPPGFLDARCEDEDILNVYQLIVFSVALATHLGLKDPQIHAIEHDAKSAQEKSLLLLKRWKQHFSIFAKRRKLVDALVKCQNSGTACEVLEALYPNYHKSPELTEQCQQHQSATTAVTGSPNTTAIQEQTPDPASGQPPPTDTQAHPSSPPNSGGQTQSPSNTNVQKSQSFGSTGGEDSSSMQVDLLAGNPVQVSPDASMPSQYPVLQATGLSPTNFQPQFTNVQSQQVQPTDNVASQQASTQQTAQSGFALVTGQQQPASQNPPGSMEDAVSLHRPAKMTGQLVLSNQSSGQPTLAQNPQAEAMDVESQGQRQSSTTVEDIREGVQDMEIEDQRNSNGRNDSGYRVDTDDGVEQDGGLFNKKKPELVPKGNNKKAAGAPPSAGHGAPPSNPTPANPQPPPGRPLKTDRTISVDDDYKMSSTPRGIGIVINNKTFDPRSRLGTRKGTNIDAQKLVNLFKWLGFDTRRFDDQTAVDMNTKLRDVAKECDKHGGYDCVMVAILSHGGDNGVIWGTDGQEVLVKSLTRYFNGSYCKSLVNKPKVFILQACRGGKKDRFVETDDSSAKSQSDSDQASLGDDPGQLESDFRKSVPTENGFIMAFSTTPGYLSWRHTDTGSWYINVLEEQMRKLAGRKHFVDILTRVNRKLSESEEFVTDYFKQMSSYESRLTRSLFFNPPLTPES